MPSNDLFPRKRRYDKGKKRGSYNIKEQDTRGKQRGEPRVVSNFYKEYIIDQIQTMSEEELSLNIDKYLEAYIAKQIERKPSWDFPERMKR